MQHLELGGNHMNFQNKKFQQAVVAVIAGILILTMVLSVFSYAV